MDSRRLGGRKLPPTTSLEGRVAAGRQFLGNSEDEEDNEKVEDEKDKRKGYNSTGEREGEGERDGKWDLQRCPMGEEKEKKKEKE